MCNYFFWLKGKLNRRPTRVDIYEVSDIPMRKFLREGWLRFLARTDTLCREEAGWLDTEAEEFLIFLERTRMVKAYKIPVIAAFLGEDNLHSAASLMEIGFSMMSFYHSRAIHERDLRDKNNRDWRSWGETEFSQLALKNPIRYLNNSPFFDYDEVGGIFYLTSGLNAFLTAKLASHVRDILEFRRRDFFRRRYRDAN